MQAPVPLGSAQAQMPPAAIIGSANAEMAASVTCPLMTKRSGRATVALPSVSEIVAPHVSDVTAVTWPPTDGNQAEASIAK